MNNWDWDSKKQMDRIKWEFRQKQIDNLQNSWLEQDVRDARLKQELDRLNLTATKTFNRLDDPTLDFSRMQREADAERLKREFRHNLIEDMKKSWIDQDLREAQKDLDNKILLDSIKKKFG